MTKTAQRIATAFQRGERLKIKATSTDGQNVWYHGHNIAWRASDGAVLASMCGWGTVTTRDRLNAIVWTIAPWTGGFSQRNHEQYFRDQPISSHDTIVLKGPDQ
jgi:hypothetical protein